MTYIYGIGRSTARKILEVAGISYDLKVQDWSDDQIGAIRSTIADMGIKVEGECRSASVTAWVFPFAVSRPRTTHVPVRAARRLSQTRKRQQSNL